MKIRLTEDVIGAYDTIYHIREIINVDEPYQGFNEDGTFTICQGMDIYIIVEKNQYEIIEDEHK